MYIDKNNNEITLGCRISDGYKGGIYTVIIYQEKLYADNGGHMFPLDSENYNLKKYVIIN